MSTMAAFLPLLQLNRLATLPSALCLHSETKTNQQAGAPSAEKTPAFPAFLQNPLPGRPPADVFGGWADLVKIGTNKQTSQTRAMTKRFLCRYMICFSRTLSRGDGSSAPSTCRHDQSHNQFPQGITQFRTAPAFHCQNNHPVSSSWSRKRRVQYPQFQT